MKALLKHISYKNLKARQKENYNYQKISAILADFGYVTFRLSDDWGGADFIAYHIEGNINLKCQLKGRISFANKYEKKKIYICFYDRDKNRWYLYPHDDLLKKMPLNIRKHVSRRGGFSRPKLSQEMELLLKPYVIPIRKSIS